MSESKRRRGRGCFVYNGLLLSILGVHHGRLSIYYFHIHIFISCLEGRYPPSSLLFDAPIKKLKIHVICDAILFLELQSGSAVLGSVIDDSRRSSLPFGVLVLVAPSVTFTT